ncbi:LysM peptidoglycan-binding domain-containing protein [Risungbinella massiliensis]|uniref:LysM peptidoglycan-binding domain-containing protein n=1 Tax=Risungbinella massiliensis TaxID=1329796 RepID=UPI0005CBC37C|nr:LysM peptidoglycan-binding domain-containing protein [Risungbinella massiliensis]
MENQFQQLRFNISEKVRLQPQQVGIRTLLELDLYPDVEIQDEGQHLKIQGYLRLHGQYLGDQLEYTESMEDATTLQSEEIAYVIPVEITLPADKAAIDYIEAEIESFDYQIQSEFELQIDAILTIDGILPEETEVAPSVVEEVKTEDNPSYERYEMDTEITKPLKQDEEVQEDLLDTEQGESLKTEQEKSLDAEQEKLQDTDQPSVIIRAEEEIPASEVTPEKVEEKQILPEEKVVPAVEEVPSQESVFTPQQDLKIEIEKRESNHLESEVEQPEELEEEVHDEGVSLEEQTDTPASTPLPSGQWSNWLIRNREDEQFTPMRMVIVQQDDTLDSLASKYEVSVNTLVSFNNLSTDRLEQGQIIKIPGTKRVG